jgi:hypothetical protein
MAWFDDRHRNVFRAASFRIDRDHSNDLDPSIDKALAVNDFHEAPGA